MCDQFKKVAIPKHEPKCPLRRKVDVGLPGVDGMASAN